MRSRVKHIITAGRISLVLLQAFQPVNFVQAAIPVEYRPNFKIASQRNDVQDILVKIQAAKQVGSNIDTNLFSRLYTNFQYVFDYFPKKPEFKTVYEQCLITSQTLSRSFDYNNFSLFSNNCFDPLQAIIKEINTTYTVQPRAEALYDQSSNSAPLTVTFDARQSQDPSNTTIPANNFFWYYRDVDGEEKIIGKGSVVKHTFTEQGNYKVRLTVRSINNADEGIFDGEQVLDISVAPQAANITIFANGKRMNDQVPTKIGTQEAQRGIRLDGSATTPLGGRQILWHEWTVEGENGFSQRSASNTPPSAYVLPIGNNGLYNVQLSVRDNEGNTVTKDFQLVVSDPVATIKQSPANGGNTSTTYSFDASTSYSVISNLKTFSRTIYDEDGNILESIQNQKTIQKRFPAPGNYTVVLRVIDEQGQENQDMAKVFVDSTPPVPQFTMEPTQQWKHPSQYIFNASATSDYDATNGNDALTYDWSFSNGENTTVEQRYDDGKRVLVSFNEKGTYTIRLTVTDRYGKIETTEKQVVIESSLRPYVFVTPIATTLGNTTNFLVKTNKSVASYEWDFGDQSKNIVQEDRISHTYKRTGAYKITLRVTTPSGEQNEVEALAFIGERATPIPAYKVFNRQGTIVMPEAFCDQPGLGTVPAYNVARYEDITLDASDSVNINGDKNGLRHYFKPQNENVTVNQQLRFNFDVLGCQVVDLTVEDTQAGKTDSRKIWFNVQNSKPTLDNLRVSFPQYGNIQGIGFGQNAQQDIFTQEYDPLIVRVDAVNARDLDGGYQGISKFRWYYYNTQDPERILEVKVTPGSTPYVYFSVPRLAGEYRFGVELYDNDDTVGITSEEIIGNGPIVVFPPDSKTPDIPVVTLLVDRPNAKVGEQLTLEVKANVLTNSSDFVANRIIKYDFDGDGIDDLSTKDTKVTYVYEKDGVYTPRVKVTYRGRTGTARGQTVHVEKGTKAQFLYATVDDKIVIRDISLGDITSKVFCLDVKTCQTNSNLLIENRSYFVATYPEQGKFAIQYDVADRYGNTSRQRGVVDITGSAPEEEALIVTLPGPSSTTGGNARVQVGKGLDNTVLFYTHYEGEGDCFVDKDIALDSNKDGSPDQDRDMACNQETMIKYTPQFDSSIARVYFEKDGLLLSKDITIEFLDFDNTLPEELKRTYGDLNVLIDQTPEDAAFLKTLLLNLRNNLIDPAAAQSIIVQIYDYLEMNPNSIGSNLRDSIIEAIVPLTNESGQSALGGTVYNNAKQGILYLLPANRRLEAEQLFISIESSDGDKGVVRDTLDQILAIAQAAHDNNEIDADDLSQVQQQRCEIIFYYSIEGTSCVNPDAPTTDIPTNTGGSSGGLSTVVKIILRVVGILGGGFVLLVVIFAVKARMQRKEEENPEQGATPTSIPTPTPTPAPTPKPTAGTQNNQGDKQQK